MKIVNEHSVKESRSQIWEIEYLNYFKRSLLKIHKYKKLTFITQNFLELNIQFFG